jgi:hypothetical protein
MLDSRHHLRLGTPKRRWTQKAEIVAALKAAFAYCDAAFEKVNDQTGKEVTDFMSRQTPRLIALASTRTIPGVTMETS